MSIHIVENEQETVSAGAEARPFMRAARLHRRGEPFEINQIPRPSPRPTDVIVQVKTCGIVQNLRNIIKDSEHIHVEIPQFPAIFGLDPVGVIAEKGELVHGFEVGDRVYVNPLRYCGTCRQCMMGEPAACNYAVLNGYFGMGVQASQSFRDYPYGGYAEYMTAPQYSLVKIPDKLSFETASRFGYLGTAYGALRRARVDMNSTVLVNGATGTLGLGGVLFALALGAPKVLGVGRDRALLERVRAICPERIVVHSTRESTLPVSEWARSITGGEGADVVMDALPVGAPLDAFMAAFDALGKCGRHVNCGGMFDKVPVFTPKFIMGLHTMLGSNWFTTAQGQEMAALVASDQVKLDIFENHTYALEDLNQALIDIEQRQGGFSNFVITLSSVGSRGPDRKVPA